MLISPIWCALNLYPKEPKNKKEFQRIVTTAQERQAKVPHTAGAIQISIYLEFKNYTKMTIMSKKSASQCKQIS